MKATKIDNFLEVEGKMYSWSSNMDRINIIRKGLPYSSIEIVCAKSGIPLNSFLELFQISPSTYRRRKAQGSLLSVRKSEFVMKLSEVLDYGLHVFNNEVEKFQRWLVKPNLSLGGISPISLFDSITGIGVVKEALNRLEYGVFA